MLDNKGAILKVKNLKLYFSTGRGKKKKTIKAVDDVSFNLYEGETFGLVGESGCGKTSTGRAIIRLHNPTSGEVYYKDKLISGKLSKDTKKLITNNIAMIFQDPIASLNPRMTVYEIIGEGLKNQGINDVTVRNKNVEEMLAKVGLLPEHASRYPHEFSGGQRQRIGIARVLVTNPSIIIADEPVSALDVSIQAQVLNLLKSLKEEFGLTILFIAHDLSVVKYFSDRIGVMNSGKIVEIAESDDLYKNPVHPYTKALLSAIPQPNPITEKNRKILTYEPVDYNHDKERFKMIEIEKNHYVFTNEKELLNYKIN